MSIVLSITGGIVSVEDGIKAKEEFAPARKARVELHFDVPEGGDHNAHVSGVVDVAKAHLHRILNTTAPVAAHVAAVPQPATPAAEPAKPETAAAKKKRLAAEAAAKPAGEKTKADLEREHLESLGGKPAAVAKTDDELLEDEPEITAAGQTVAPVEEDDLNDLLGEATPTPITDLELANAVQKKNAERKEADLNWAPAKIRDVIATYSGGKRVNDIPAAKRAEFLKKIEALK
jgi:hypothetical protein